MKRCPDCRAILSQKAATCPFCGGVDVEGAQLQAVAHPDLPPLPTPAAAPRKGTANGFATGSGTVWTLAPAPQRAPGADAREPSAFPASEPQREVAEERVSRHDEPIGFQRSGTVQAILILLLLLFLVAALVWFWN